MEARTKFGRSKSVPELKGPEVRKKTVWRTPVIVTDLRQLTDPNTKTVISISATDKKVTGIDAEQNIDSLGKTTLSGKKGKGAERMERLTATSEEKQDSAVIFAERIADFLDDHQQHAVENNAKELLSNIELVGRFKIIFFAGMEKMQQFPIAMNIHETYDFLHGIQFEKNYLRHIKARTYLNRQGTAIATGTAPSTPGIKGWIHFATGKKIRKSDGYGDKIVEEALRRGIETAIFPARSPSFQESQLTPDVIAYIQGKVDQEERSRSEHVIRTFKMIDEKPRAAWLEQAERGFREMTGRPAWNDMNNQFAMPGRVPTNDCWQGTAEPTYNPYSSYQAGGQASQQGGPAINPSHQSNFPFADQFGVVRAVSGGSYHSADQYQQYVSGNGHSQAAQMQQPVGSGVQTQNKRAQRYPSKGKPAVGYQTKGLPTSNGHELQHEQDVTRTTESELPKPKKRKNKNFTRKNKKRGVSTQDPATEGNAAAEEQEY